MVVTIQVHIKRSFHPLLHHRKVLASLQPVLALQDKLRTSPQLGIVHLTLHSGQIGLIMSWKSDIISVAEPGEMAEGFLQTVAANMRIGATGKARKKRGSQLPKFSSLSSLVASCPRFMIVGGLPRFMGRHTQVLPDGQEVGSHLFRRTLRWMVGGWRNRIVICTGRYGPPAALVKAFLDSGAKAVITPSADPPEPSSPAMVLMVEAALEHALEAHVKQQYQYRCHLTQFF
ncbi:hypothetical protein R1sor_012800 [Riccia sorocarpa]|uniref:Uncharacterized protein n=1 Tax=Riccia sorocarpa TaxID=122646 RepID=A0ABD3I6P1_9MARC